MGPSTSAVSEGCTPLSVWVWKLPIPCCGSQAVGHTNGASRSKEENGQNWNQKSGVFPLSRERMLRWTSLLPSAPLNNGLPRWGSGKEPTCQCRRHRDTGGFLPGSGRFPWSRKQQLIPGFFPGRFHGQRSLAVCNPHGGKESDMTEYLRTHTYTHPSKQCFWLLIWGIFFPIENMPVEHTKLQRPVMFRKSYL